MMKFKCDGKTYYLQFSRKHSKVTYQLCGKRTTTTSKYPYTTATLLEEDPAIPGNFATKNVIAEHIVGCLPTDPYSHNMGRIMALRGLTSLLPKELRTAVWQAYEKRKEG